MTHDASPPSSPDAVPTRDPLGVLWAPSTMRLRCAALTRAVDNNLSSWFKLQRDALGPLADELAADPLLASALAQPLSGPDNPWSLWAEHAPQRLTTVQSQWAALDPVQALRSQVDLSVLAVWLSEPPGGGWAFEDRPDSRVAALAMPAQRQQRDDLLALLDQASGTRAPTPPEATGGLPPEGAGLKAVALDASAAAASASEPVAPSAATSVAKPAGMQLSGRAGLAVAVLRAFQAGVFSADAADPLRVDARVLTQLDAAALRAVFQSGAGSAPSGLGGLAAQLKRLGQGLEALASRSGAAARPCLVADEVLAQAQPCNAGALLSLLTRRLAPTVPDGVPVLGLPGGDIRSHRWAGAETLEGPHRASSDWVPLHTLCRQLVIALAEPLSQRGIALTRLQDLPAGGSLYQGHVFLQRGIVVPRQAQDLKTPRQRGDEWVTEWRALTVSLMDELAERVRQLRGFHEAECPAIALCRHPLLRPTDMPVVAVQAPAPLD